MIAEKDSDGAVSFSYHDDTAEALALQQKLQQLEKYAGNVDKYVKEKIDRPFYEAMNKVAEKLEALNIGNYKTGKYVGEVTLPKGSLLRMGEVNPVFSFKGGGIQFDLMGQFIGDFKELGKIIE